MNRNLENRINELLGKPNIELNNINKIINYKTKYIPKKIYKFRGFQDSKHLENFRNNNLWCSNASDFNDPYDSALCFDINKSLNFIMRERKQEIINNLGKDENKKLIKRILSKVLYKIVLSLLTSIRYDKEYKHNKLFSTIQMIMKNEDERFNKWFSEGLQKTFKICSFSERIDSTLMWAHYSEGHQGFAIEYNFSELSIDDLRNRFFWPVIYSDTLFNGSSILNYGLEKEQINIFFALLGAIHKAKDWEYENEWRLCIPPKDPDDQSMAYEMPKPKAVYLGSKISGPNKELIMKEANKKRINIYQMEIESKLFKMKPVKI